MKTLGTVLAADAVFSIASKKERSSPLKAIYDKYAKAGITTANYTSESSIIESMLQDFAAVSLAENIKSVKAEINRMNDAISKRGKKPADKAAE